MSANLSLRWGHLLFVSILILSCHAQDQAEHKNSREKQDIVVKLKANSFLPVAEQVDLYIGLKASHPDAYNFENEDQLTMYGYGMLWDNRPADALVIFNLIADQFPESSNAYDSIGEAYFNLDKMGLALANYEKSLAMNPDNYNAEDYIERIKYPDKKMPSVSELFTKVFSIDEYKMDLDDLGRKLIKTHPGIFKFTSEEEFLSIIESKKKLIHKKTTYASFRWHCNEIVASVNCSHTGIAGFTVENEMLPDELKFPIQTVLLNDGLFVTHVSNSFVNVRIGDQIVSINGMPIEDLVKEVFRHIPSQGLIETSKRIEFNQWARTLIPYALDFPSSYTIELADRKELITLQSLPGHREPKSNNFIKDCGDALCLDFVNDSTAVHTIASFVFYRWNNFNDFVDFIDGSFIQIAERDIDHLIIDVRRNGGGAPEASIHLLQYIANRPFEYFPDVESVNGGGVRDLYENSFKGQLYFLIDGQGNSTTGHFMAMVKEMELGVIIGEELGSNHYCTAGQTIFKLKNTRLQFYSANNENWVTANSLSPETGILPDYYISQDIDDYLNKKDVVKDFALDLIGE